MCSVVVCKAAALCVWMSACVCMCVRASPPSDAVPALLCVSTPVIRARLCVNSTSRLPNVVVLVFGMPVCVPCAIHSLFAVAVLSLLFPAVCTCMVSLSLRCDLCERRRVTGLSSGGMTASGSWVLSFGSL